MSQPHARTRDHERIRFLRQVAEVAPTETEAAKLLDCAKRIEEPWWRTALHWLFQDTSQPPASSFPDAPVYCTHPGCQNLTFRGHHTCEEHYD